MTDDLNTLRPEVQAAMIRLESYLHITIGGKHFRSEDYDTIRAELLRLQSTESRANEWQLHAERAEAELAEARKNETVALGLWNAAEDRATKAEAELAALRELHKAVVALNHDLAIGGVDATHWMPLPQPPKGEE